MILVESRKFDWLGLARLFRFGHVYVTLGLTMQCKPLHQTPVHNGKWGFRPVPLAPSTLLFLSVLSMLPIKNHAEVKLGRARANFFFGLRPKRRRRQKKSSSQCEQLMRHCQAKFQPMPIVPSSLFSIWAMSIIPKKPSWKTSWSRNST